MTDEDKIYEQTAIIHKLEKRIAKLEAALETLCDVESEPWSWGDIEDTFGPVSEFCREALK